MLSPFFHGVSGVTLDTLYVKYSSRAHESVLCIKMLLHEYLLVIICGVFIASGAVSGEEEKKAVGEEVSFRPDKPLPASVTSFTWKHTNNGVTIKAIEWEDGVILSPHPRFNGITSLDTATGQITITKLTVEHSGVYTIDISGKEQAERFTLTVMNRVPKPVIEVEKIKDNPNVVYLACKYNASIIWTNSAGEELAVVKLDPKGESITVKKTEGNPDNIYSCTLKNAVSEETSDPVTKKDLFNVESDQTPWWIVALIIGVLLGIFAAPLALYKLCTPFHDCVYKSCGNKPCIKGLLSCLDGKNKDGNIKADAKQGQEPSSVKMLDPDMKNDDAQSPNSNAEV